MIKKIIFALSITLITILTLGFAHAGSIILFDNNFYWGDNTSWLNTEKWTESTYPAPLTANDNLFFKLIKFDLVGLISLKLITYTFGI